VALALFVAFTSQVRISPALYRRVLWITLLAMVGEIVAGLVFNSMALLADGWHMASHHSGPVPPVATERATSGASPVPARDRRRLH